MSIREKFQSMLQHGDVMNNFKSALVTDVDASSSKSLKTAASENSRELVNRSVKTLLEKTIEIPNDFMLADTETSDVLLLNLADKAANDQRLDNSLDTMSDVTVKMKRVHDIMERDDGNAELLKISEDAMRFREERVEIARELIALQSAREKYNKIKETNFKRESIVKKSKMVWLLSQFTYLTTNFLNKIIKCVTGRGYPSTEREAS